MKRQLCAVFALVLFTLVTSFDVGAVEAPHVTTCSSCHNSSLPADSVTFNNNCMSCHADFNSGTNSASKLTSHKWDGSVANPNTGAQSPATGALSQVQNYTNSQLACVNCHNPHSNGSPMGNGKYQRVANDTDQLCLDCHRSRNVQTAAAGSHPVLIGYSSAAKAAPQKFVGKIPLNANPANPTSDLGAKLSHDGKLLCSTCHGVHSADSRSSNFDISRGFKNISSGDGNLLRTNPRGAKVTAGSTDKMNICTNCHAGKMNHNAMGQDIQCIDCHGAHVEYDSDDPSGSNGTNISLIRRNVTKSGQASKIFFRSAEEYVNSDGAGPGVCQGCHTAPVTGTHAGVRPTDCKTCHTHNSAQGAFSPSCGSCHGYPPAAPHPNNTSCTLCHNTDPSVHNNGVVNVSANCDACHGNPPTNGAHVKHAGTGVSYSYACSECHKGNTHGNGSMQDVFIDKSGILAGSAATYTTATKTCSSLYCHSNGTSLATGQPATGAVAWGSGTLSCNGCHSNPPAYANNSPKANSHGSSHNYGCETCHAGTTANGFTISDSTKHVNGAYNVSPGAGATFTYTYANTGGTCSNISCHQGVNAKWGSNADHTATLGYGSFYFVSNSHDDGERWMGEACVTCHYANIAVQHNNDCALCHAGTNPAGALIGSWNKSCQSCHSSIHPPTATDHAAFVELNNCEECHDSSSWSVDCTFCHSQSQTLSRYIDAHPPAYDSPPTVIKGNLKLSAHMDEPAWYGTPNEVKDSSGWNSHGTAFNGATTVAGGVSNRAGSFNGVNSKVTMRYATGTIPINTFTIEAWVKPSAPHEVDPESTSGYAGVSGQKYLFWPDHNGSNSGSGVSVGTNGISVYEHGGSYMPALAVYSGPISSSQWTHIAVVYENKRPSIYVNGALVRTGLQSPRQIVYAPQTIGGELYGYFSGLADEVAIYDAALTGTEILQHAQQLCSTTSNTAVSIRWTSAIASSSYVDYGLTTIYDLTTGNGALVNTHLLALSNIADNMTYHYRVRSTTAAGIETVSADATFTTSSCAPITTPPSVPSNISAVAGNAQATLTWTPGTGASSSLIRYGSTSGNMSTVIDPASLPQKITGLTNGVATYYQVGSKNPAGTTWNSTTYTVTPVAPTLATLTTPTATAVSRTTATLGANVTSNGGTALVANGTCWGTTANPSTNCVDQGSHALGVFTQNRTALPEGSLVYYRGYASNSMGSAYSPGGTIYTEPTQPNTLSYTNVGANGLTLNWVTGSIGTAKNVIVVMKSGSAVSSDPLDGTTYTADAAFGNGSQIGSLNYVVYKGTGNSVAITGLSPGVTYFFKVYAFAAGAVGTENYNVVSPLAGSRITSASATVPALTTPTVTSIGSTTATLGANVTSNGGAALSANGTCWGTTANPTTNCVDQGSHVVGAFTQNRTALPEGSLIYYRGYATNSAGTGYSSSGTFYTEPIQPTTPSYTSVGTTGLTLNWATASSGTAKNVIVVMRSGSAVNADPLDGSTYTANGAFGSGSQIGTLNYVVYKGTGNSIAVTGLSPGTTYYVKVYSYAAGTAGTENYNITSPIAGSQTTTTAAGGGDMVNLTYADTATPYLNKNIYDDAKAAGWNGTSAVTINVTVGAGVVIGSSSPSSPALTTNNPTAIPAQTFPIGTIINVANNGRIAGAGGYGGGSGAAGGAGGDAFLIKYPLTLNNQGTISGGGGGGGGGADDHGGSAGGSGGQGAGIAAPQAGEFVFIDYHDDPYSCVAVSGGNGGATGFSGYNGEDGNEGETGGPGGAPGWAITGIDNVINSANWGNSGVFAGNNIQAENNAANALQAVRATPVIPVAVPVLSSPTATSIGSSTATLGANVTSNGGAALTANGTCWGTSASPTTNCVDQGSHALGPFTQSRTALPEGSLVYYRGYATNSAGTGYSTGGTVYTEPTQPNTLNYPSVGANGLTVSWVTGSSGTAKNVIVVMRSGSAVTSDPLDGTSYTTNGAFGSGSQVGSLNYVVYKGTGNSVAVTGLSPNTTYYVKVYAFAAGTAGTENYNITSPLTGSRITNAPATLPTLTTPTATSIGSSTATLGANVTSNGGAALTANGTCWGTTVNPTTNCVDQGSHAVGAFTQNRSVLPEGSLIYYRGYATNSAGTGYSPGEIIYTEPIQPITPSYTSVGSTGLTVNWATASSGTAKNVIVVMRAGSAVNADPLDGTTYTASGAFGSGSQIGALNYVVYKGTGTSVAVTGLSPGTTYYVKVYAFSAGAAGTENYNITSPIAGSQATTATAGGSGTVDLTNADTATPYLNKNIYDDAKAAGWNGTSAVTINVTVGAGVVIGSSSPSSPALITNNPTAIPAQTFPVGTVINLANNGRIAGAGGYGGGSESAGGAGGDALVIRYPLTLNNQGTIAGGGGGGGGGADDHGDGSGGPGGQGAGIAAAQAAEYSYFEYHNDPSSCVAVSGGDGGAAGFYGYNGEDGNEGSSGGAGGAPGWAVTGITNVINSANWGNTGIFAGNNIQAVNNAANAIMTVH